MCPHALPWEANGQAGDEHPSVQGSFSSVGKRLKNGMRCVIMPIKTRQEAATKEDEIVRVKPNRKLPVMVVIILIVIVAAIGGIQALIESRIPTKEVIDLTEVYPEEEGTAVIISNGVTAQIRGIWKDGTTYLPFGIVRDELNDHFYWDDTEKLLICTTATEIIEADEQTTYQGAEVFLEKEAEDGETLDVDDRIYVSLDYVAQYTNIQVDTYASPNRVFIRSQYGSTKYGTAKKGAAVRVDIGIKREVLTTLDQATDVWVIESQNGWSKVYVDGDVGVVGYIRNRDLTSVETVMDNGPYEAEEYTRLASDEQVCLVWHQVFNSSGLDDLDNLLSNTKGLTVISPTWFSIMDSQGTITSRANQEYVDKAHAKGLQVWALLENINASEELDNTKLLKTTSIRRQMIETLIHEALSYGIDGINVDLEGLSSSAGSAYIQFIRELSVYCRNNGLVLSVDNYVPSAWTTHYHRDQQAEVVDYFIIMAYDEHYSGSEAGSTSSLSFVEEGIADTIAEGVPEEKIIVALPFYSRLWTGESTYPYSETVSMSAMQELMTRTDITLTWDSDLGQFYVESSASGELERCWIEDATSLRKKLGVMSNYSLGGVAGWKLGMETTDAWMVISEYLAGE